MTAFPAISTQYTTITYNGVTIGGVTAITGLGTGTATEKDITTLASSAKETQPGLRDFGTFELELIRNQDDLGQLELYNAQANQSVNEVVVTLSGSSANVGTFQGWVKSLSSEIGKDASVMGKCSIRVTGDIVWS